MRTAFFTRATRPAISTLLAAALSAALFAARPLDAAKPPAAVPCEAISVYPASFAHHSAELTHAVPGDIVGAGSGIAWDWYFEATLPLDNYRMGVAGISISFLKNSLGQVNFIRVKGQAGPPGGPWPWHDTDLIPVLNSPVMDLVHGFTMQIRLDHIPMHVHSNQRESSPRVGIAGYFALGDLVVYPKP
jgi:hypothetical protein